MKKYLNLSLFLVIAGFLLYVVFPQLKCCRNAPAFISSDTVYISHIDTILDTIVRTRIVKIPLPIRDTIFVNSDSTSADSILQAVNRYTTDVSDTMIEGKVESWVMGALVRQVFEYKPLFPKYIIRTDSIIIHSVLSDKKHFKVFVGGTIGIGPKIALIAPNAGIQARNGYYYQYGYELMQKTHNLSIMIPIK